MASTAGLLSKIACIIINIRKAKYYSIVIEISYKTKAWYRLEYDLSITTSSGTWYTRKRVVISANICMVVLSWKMQVGVRPALYINGGFG